MDEIEIQIFDEITNYKEKFGWFTIRQWIFIVLIGITVVPTYIFLPRVVGDDITSYVILIEAAGIGFIGFVPVHNLPTEKFIPYWIRHYFFFHKPIEYMTIQEYKELKEQKKNKKSNKKTKDNKKKNNKIEHLKDTEPSVNVEKEKTDTEPIVNQTSKKTNLTKEEKALKKAKKKYGYIFEKTEQEEKEIVNQDIQKISPNISKEEKTNIQTNPIVTENTNNETTVEQMKSPNEKTSKSDELNKRFNMLSDAEKEVFLKLVGK